MFINMDVMSAPLHECLTPPHRDWQLFQGRREVTHRNVAVGVDERHAKWQHPVMRMMRERGLPTTAANISMLGVYHSTEQLEANVGMLEKELENFWRVNGLGEYPVDAKLSVASRVKLWAAGTHADIGYAAAHPNFDGKARWMHTSEALLPSYFPIECTTCN